MQPLGQITRAPASPIAVRQSDAAARDARRSPSATDWGIGPASCASPCDVLLLRQLIHESVELRERCAAQPPSTGRWWNKPFPRVPRCRDGATPTRSAARCGTRRESVQLVNQKEQDDPARATGTESRGHRPRRSRRLRFRRDAAVELKDRQQLRSRRRRQRARDAARVISRSQRPEGRASKADRVGVKQFRPANHWHDRGQRGWCRRGAAVALWLTDHAHWPPSTSAPIPST